MVSRLPLPDAAVDAAFANMYLHHCPDPQEAIREMVRILRPGGRLVITDMDTTSYEWLKSGDGGYLAGLRAQPDPGVV